MRAPVFAEKLGPGAVGVDVRPPAPPSIHGSAAGRGAAGGGLGAVGAHRVPGIGAAALESGS